MQHPFRLGLSLAGTAAMAIASASTKGKSRLFPCHHFALRVTTKDSVSVEIES